MARTTARVTITVPMDLLEKIDRMAEGYGMSRSEAISAFLEESVTREQQGMLSALVEQAKRMAREAIDALSAEEVLAKLFRQTPEQARQALMAERSSRPLTEQTAEERFADMCGISVRDARRALSNEMSQEEAMALQAKIGPEFLPKEQSEEVAKFERRRKEKS